MSNQRKTSAQAVQPHTQMVVAIVGLVMVTADSWILYSMGRRMPIEGLIFLIVHLSLLCLFTLGAFLGTQGAGLLEWTEQARVRVEAGLCPACNYDIRTHRGRCPECGWPLLAPNQPIALPRGWRPSRRMLSRFISLALAQREPLPATAWKSARHYRVARFIAEECQKALHWPNANFLPDDPWWLMSLRRRGVVEAVIKSKLALRVSHQEFRSALGLSFGEFVDFLLTRNPRLDDIPKE